MLSNFIIKRICEKIKDCLNESSNICKNIGVQSFIEIHTPKNIFENRFLFKFIEKNLEQLNNQIVIINDSVKSLIIKQKEFEELKIKYSELNKENSKFKNDINLLKDELSKTKIKLEELQNKQKHEELKTNKLEIKKEIKVEPAPLASDLIRLRDHLLVFKINTEGDALKVINSIYKEQGKILKANGVEPIEDNGLFNPDKHTIIETKQTSDISLNDNIFDTVRPGYRMGDVVIRNQEVIIYVSDSNN